MDPFKLLLLLHIVGGGVSLVLGGCLLTMRKGGRRHRLLGNIYFYAMLSSALAALPMSVLHPNYFLFIVGVFTSYMLLTGKRYTLKKKDGHALPVDWVLTLIMLLFGTAFIGLGAWNLIRGNSFGAVFLVFGCLSLLFVRQDYVNYSGKSTVKNYWLTTHIQRMLGSYIASVTAFLVVNNTLLPGIIAWLLPTAAIVPLIISWTKKYAVRLTPAAVR